MKATELRIGNWVRIKDVPTTNEWQVESIGNLQQVRGQLWSIEELEPITITKEWLTKLGFREWGDFWFHDDGHMITENAYGCNGNYGYCINDEKVIYKEVKFVHRLQNISFEMEDKELTLTQ